MYCPTIGERVRVIGRVEEYLLVSIDYDTRIAGILSQFEGTRDRESIPFHMLLEVAGYEEAASVNEACEVMLESSVERLRTTAALICCAARLIVDLQESISATLAAIRNSQQRISRSDEVIARTRLQDCGWPKALPPG